MQTGAITGYVDVAQLALYGFWIFFAGLIYYLQREMKREGYPLESDRSANITVQGWPAIPEPKTYLLANGDTVSVPNNRVDNQPPLHEGAYRGSPLQPIGNPMWVDRSEMLFRYLEVETTGNKRVLLPMNFAKVQARRVLVKSILGEHFVDVPATKSPEQVTLLEEEKVMAYYGAGTLYATAARQEPLL